MGAQSLSAAGHARSRLGGGKQHTGTLVSKAWPQLLVECVRLHQACGWAEALRLYATRMDFVSGAQTRLLTYCASVSSQAGSYALAQYQAFVRQQQEQVAVASRVVPDNSTAATAAGSSAQAPPRAPSPSTSGRNTSASGAMAVVSPASAAIAGTGAVTVVTDVEDFCLLWGVELFSSAGYMNAQCSEGYTGRLCAVCEQGACARACLC